MSYRLVALDVDGTLVGEDLQVPPRTANAIQQAQDAGVLVTLATGRMFASARQFALPLDIQTPLICYQGAMIANPQSTAVLFQRGVPYELALAVIRRMRNEGHHVNVYLDDMLYVDQLTPGAELYARMARVEAHVVGDVVPLLEAAKARDIETTKLVVIANEAETLRVCADLQAAFNDGLNVVRSYRFFTEITHPSVSKGPALAWLANYLGIAQSEVLAIGDNDNDIDMLLWAGLGVAMGQANAQVRAAADFTTSSILEAGAAAAIERFVLNEAGAP